MTTSSSDLTAIASCRLSSPACIGCHSSSVMSICKSFALHPERSPVVFFS